MDCKPRVIVIEGPLGVGKSTLLRSLVSEHSDEFSIIHVPEDLPTWTNWYGENVLKRSIHTKDNVFFFQVLVLHTYIQTTKRAYEQAERSMATDGKPTFVIVERSPLTAGLHVFCEIAHNQMGTLTTGEFELIKGLYNDIGETNMSRFLIPDLEIGLWTCGEQFEPILWPRVVARDGDMACRDWAEKVYDAYDQYFRARWDTIHMVECTQPKEIVVRNVVDVIKSKFSLN